VGVKRAVQRGIIPILICLITWVSNVQAAPPSFSPYLETFPNGKIDWDQGYFYGTGKGYLHLNGGSRAKSLKVAQAEALSAILQVAAGIRLNDRKTILDLQKDQVILRLQAFVRYEPYEREYVQDRDQPHYRVTYRAPMKGVQGLTKRLLEHLKENPSAWKDFPSPERDREAHDEEDSWVVFDARRQSASQRAQPALFPKVLTEKGDVVYDLNRAEEEAVVRRGMARYVVSDEPRETWGASKTGFLRSVLNLLQSTPAWAQENKNRKKRRSHYIVTDVTQIQGLKKTNLIISEGDAKRLKQEDRSSKILKQCRVIVVVSSSVGGIEGALEDSLALGR
jgi:hypothetical protein